MAKLKSQIMKDYRERKKALLGDEWLKRENTRVKGYYVPVSELNRVKQKQRRERNRLAKQRSRRKRKLEDNKQNEGENTEIENVASTSTTAEDMYGVSSTTDILKVKLPFRKKRKSGALAKSNRRIKVLENRNRELLKRIASTRRQLLRLKGNKNKNLTPRSKVDGLLRQSKLRPESVPEVRKRLLFSECLTEEVKDASTNNKKNVVMSVISGRIVKKYRLSSMLEKLTGIDKRHGRSIQKKVEIKPKSRLESLRQKIQSDIHTFLKREDNSRILPGKKDAVKVDTSKAKSQKYILNDYLHNLHSKFCAESEYSLSLSTFCRNRPKEVSLVSFTSRNVCLCSKHQNFSLKLRCLKNMGVCTCTSPDKFIEEFNDNNLDELLEKITVDKVKYQEWKRVKMSDGKERIRVVDQELERSEFLKEMKASVANFCEHVRRVKEQYRSLRSMKENLPDDHAIIQMDFSENYTCQSMEEIQSAYWNASMVTLHPCVIYFRQNVELAHKSTVFVSNVLHHNSSMVYAIVEKVMAQMKTDIPSLKFVHFWTDSPTSQYRNKYIFDLVSQFDKRFNVKSSWQYFESGHGKSACDGIGGSTKRNADNAVKRGTVIQDAHDFFAWAKQSEGEISYEFVTEEEFLTSKSLLEIQCKVIKPVTGTMSIHSVAGLSENVLLTRTTTCICDNCFSVNGFNAESTCGWTKHILRKNVQQTVNESTHDSQIATDNVEDRAQPTSTESFAKVDDVVEELHLTVDFYVLALYDNIIYVGQILEVDDQDDTVNITCMEKSEKIENQYKWPGPKADEVWVYKHDILKVIPEPIPMGKSRRLFKLSNETLDFIRTYKA